MWRGAPHRFSHKKSRTPPAPAWKPKWPIAGSAGRLTTPISNQQGQGGQTIGPPEQTAPIDRFGLRVRRAT